MPTKKKARKTAAKTSTKKVPKKERERPIRKYSATMKTGVISPKAKTIVTLEKTDHVEIRNLEGVVRVIVNPHVGVKTEYNIPKRGAKDIRIEVVGA